MHVVTRGQTYKQTKKKKTKRKPPKIKYNKLFEFFNWSYTIVKLCSEMKEMFVWDTKKDKTQKTWGEGNERERETLNKIFITL